MGTYTTIVAQKQVDGRWVTLAPVELGYDPEIPHHYGKLDMMAKLDPVTTTPEERGRYYYHRQEFMSGNDYGDPEEHAPWAKRGLPEGLDEALLEEIDDGYGFTWVTLDELLGYDFDTEQALGLYDKRSTWNEHLGPGFRLWFEKLRDYGAERVICCLS